MPRTAPPWAILPILSIIPLQVLDTIIILCYYLLTTNKCTNWRAAARTRRRRRQFNLRKGKEMTDFLDFGAAMEISTVEDMTWGKGYFLIPEENLEKLVKKFQYLGKAADKLGCDPIEFQIIGWELVREDAFQIGFVEAGLDDIDVIRCAKVTVTGKAPVLNGWSLAAVVQHEEAGNIIRKLPGAFEVSIPEVYLSGKATCAYCNKPRNRKDTYLVVNAAGEMLEVGKNCLKDFTGHSSPEAIARYLEQILDALKVNGSGEGSSGHYMYLQAFMCHVVAVVEAQGWVSKSKAQEFGGQATINAVINNIYDTKNQKKSALAITEAHEKTAAQIIEWVRSDLAKKPYKSDYEHNLVVALGGQEMNWRNGGIAASAIAAWKHATEKKAEIKAQVQNSKHQGQLGSKLTVKVLVKGCSVSSFSVAYRTTVNSYFYRMVDGAGNIYVWSSSNEIMEEGKEYTLTGTVKEHTEYKGIAQTVLTRCKVQG